MTTFDCDMLHALRDASEITIRTDKLPRVPCRSGWWWTATMPSCARYRVPGGPGIGDLAAGAERHSSRSPARGWRCGAVPASDPGAIERASREYSENTGSSPYAQTMVKPRAAVDHAATGTAINGEVTMEIKRNGSQASNKGPADWFTGTVRIDPLFQAPEPRVFRRQRHFRAGCAQRLAYPSARPDADRHGRLRLGAARRRTSRGDPAG